MDCNDVKTQLSRGEAPAGDHMDRCPACQELTASGGVLGRALAAIPAAASDLDLGAGFLNLTQSLQADRGLRPWLASRPTWERRLVLVSALAAILLVSFGFLVRPDLSIYPAGRMTLVLVGLASVGVAGAWTTLRPLQRPPGSRNVWTLLLVAGLLWPVVVGLLPAAHQAHAASVQGTGAMLAQKAAACFVFGLVFALPVLVLAWLFNRSPRHYRLSTQALLAAVVAGLGGNLALQAHCPITGQEHLLVGHATVAPALVAACLLARLRA
jgi:hypothetical protein